MDSPTPTARQAGFSAKNSAVDVSQLDKVNAIPNKAADNVLLSNLCAEDQHYLKFMMENDPSDSDEDNVKQVRHSSSGAWSPMVQSPMMNKRKGTKPPYAITLSLEDISYIRPSWGISKGIRSIELDAKKSKKVAEKRSPSDSASKDLAAKRAKDQSNNKSYKYFLLMLTLVVIFLTLPTYLGERKKQNNLVARNRLQVNTRSRTMEIYRPDVGLNQALGEAILRVDFALGIPTNLRPDGCTCELYVAELRRYANLSAAPGENKNQHCFTCLDWAYRANFRLLVEHIDTGICYNIKWQSYDNLATPLVDCFQVDKNDQWLGLGDIRSPEWTLNKLQFDWTPLATNLAPEYASHQQVTTSRVFADSAASPSLGAYANLTLFASSGIFVGHLRSDFRLFVKVEQVSYGRRICIKASCNEKCSKFWGRAADLEEFRYANNVLEYRICSSGSVRTLISNHIGEKMQLLDSLVRGQVQTLELSALNNSSLGSLEVHHNSSVMTETHLARLIERESNLVPQQQQQQQQQLTTETKIPISSTGGSISSLPEGIGLIERTIFSTSADFMPLLDGKTLRQYVDSVVKMGLKTSSILLIDCRWETYVGSLELDTNLFSKWRLLFEIIHNKGFKVLLTVKPFVDTVIGAGSINQLFEAGKLYGVGQGLERADLDSESRSKEIILRRKSLFSISNESVEIGQNGSATFRPYLFRCKESQVGHCALFDLNKNQTRAWLINQIAQSELLTSDAADGILMAGSHPDPSAWDHHYRTGLSQLIHSLYFRERIFTLPQWTGQLGYIQLASRPFSWPGLRSVLNSVLNLGLDGFSLIHPGSVWGDLRSYPSVGNVSSSLSSSSSSSAIVATGTGRSQVRKEPIDLEDYQAQERSNEELCIRWLQVSIFLPILQFNNLAPIERYGLLDLMQSLIKTRRLYVIAELKKHLPFTPLISQSRYNSSSSSSRMALIRPVWFSQQQLSVETPDTIVAEQFSIGPDIMVAPVLSEGIRQRDIYLPNGFWRDELRQINIRGGKWLRNYPIELTEIAWFTRLKR